LRHQRSRAAWTTPEVVVRRPQGVAQGDGADVVHSAEALVCAGAVVVVEHGLRKV
jgi:hypothetical protein